MLVRWLLERIVQDILYTRTARNAKFQHVVFLLQSFHLLNCKEAVRLQDKFTVYRGKGPDPQDRHQDLHAWIVAVFWL